MTNGKDMVALRAVLYDAKGRDREVEVRPGLADELDEHHLLWIDVDGRDADAIGTLVELFGLPDETASVLASDEAAAQLLRYPDRVHLRLVAMQPNDSDGTARQSCPRLWPDLDRHRCRQERGHHRPSGPCDCLRPFPRSHPRRYGASAR